MTDVNCLDFLSQELGFVLKLEQRGALELLLRVKDVFCVLPTALFIWCLSSCQNNCFLCRVDYGLEENVLTEQMWIFAAYYWEVVTLLLIFSGRHDLPSDARAFSFLAS